MFAFSSTRLCVLLHQHRRSHIYILCFLITVRSPSLLGTLPAFSTFPLRPPRISSPLRDRRAQARLSCLAHSLSRRGRPRVQPAPTRSCRSSGPREEAEGKNCTFYRRFKHFFMPRDSRPRRIFLQLLPPRFHSRVSHFPAHPLSSLTNERRYAVRHYPIAIPAASCLSAAAHLVAPR